MRATLLLAEAGALTLEDVALVYLAERLRQLVQTALAMVDRQQLSHIVAVLLLREERLADA